MRDRLQEISTCCERLPLAAVRVEFSSVEDVRRQVFLILEGVVSQRERARLAGLVAARLRDAGLLGGSFEQHYSAAQAGRLAGGRSAAWAVKHAKAGDFGPVAWADGLLIPASGLNGFVSDRILTASTEVAA